MSHLGVMWARGVCCHVMGEIVYGMTVMKVREDADVDGRHVSDEDESIFGKEGHVLLYPFAHLHRKGSLLIMFNFHRDGEVILSDERKTEHRAWMNYSNLRQ